MNSEYENNSQHRKTLQELKQMNQPNQQNSTELSSPTTPVVIQCPLPEALAALTQKTETIGREVHAMREYLPNLKSRTDLTAVQNTMTEMKKTLMQLTSLLEQAGKKKEMRTCKWLNWLPDFDLIIVTKWITLVLLIVAVLLAMGYGTGIVVSNIRNLFL